MKYSRESLEKLLVFIGEICDEADNSWFKHKLTDKFGHSSTRSTLNNHELDSIKNDTNTIRSHLDIRGDNSINFSFVQHKRVQNQLLKDNLRMENIRLDITIKNENERFYLFCVNAFYQIEELINYYFGTKYSFEEFLNLLREKNKNSNKVFNQKQLSEITISEKIYVFEAMFFYNRITPDGKKIKYEPLITLIREVRNADAHRCNIIDEDTEHNYSNYQELLKKITVYNNANRALRIYYNKTEEDKVIEKKGKLYNFIHNKDYDSVRAAIEEISAVIKKEFNI